MFNPAILDEAAKALWELTSHPMLARGGYPTDWESQPATVKKSVIRQVRTVLKVCENHADIEALKLPTPEQEEAK